MRRFALLVNPTAARGKATRILPAVRRQLDALGARHRVVVSASLDHAVQEAVGSAADGDTVLALGGDGFLGPLAGALRGAATALALVPAGRGNDFARAIGVPEDPCAAARLAVEGEERLIDVAFVDGRPYLGIASVGFDSDVQRLANRTRLVAGSLVYVYAALRALHAWRPATFETTVDGSAHRTRGYAVAVANSGVYGGGMRLLPGAQLDDGRLDVLLIADHGKLGYLRSLPRVFKGTHLEGNPFACRVEGRSVRIEADRPFTVYADGDAIGELPVTVSVVSRCLRVIAPPGLAG